MALIYFPWICFRITYQTVCKALKETSFLVHENTIYLGHHKAILRPLLLNIFMYDMFISKAVYFTGYADDNTPFAIADNIKDVIRSSEEAGENLIT